MVFDFEKFMMTHMVFDFEKFMMTQIRLVIVILTYG
jgi:hypothetical protein